MNDSMQKNTEDIYKRPYIDMLFLLLLTKEDMYGAQLYNEMKYLTNGVFVIKQGSLYAPLYKLIEKGYISEHKELRGRRQLLSYYHIEPEGIEYLNCLLEAEQTVLSAVCSLKEAVNYKIDSENKRDSEE